jgi:hypothetical protein
LCKEWVCKLVKECTNGKYLYGSRGIPSTGYFIGGTHSTGERGKWNLIYNE